ncbi:hypothetical protein Clacol_006950 [Clathrus columnatus]|uniref:Carbonic anhydrase n=1 Tax=Clathrus columnatus TaxID=1419009 RepID=A0AAV5ADL1_9AGAM|nr:hypothetical protein Clacol_006950 [Clathrus columnatus]
MCLEGFFPFPPLLAELLTSNACWTARVTASNPNFFPRSAEGQSPRVLWIGCSNSRVPESVITDSKPGDIFTTWNIANQFHTDDLSSQCVLEFVINGLPNIEHVIVVGHTNCGGVKAALDAARDGIPVAPPLDRWLEPLVAHIKTLPDLPNQTLSNVVKENVKMQIENICSSDTIKSIKKTVYIHGWMYHLEQGHLEDLGFTWKVTPNRSEAGPAPGEIDPSSHWNEVFWWKR